MFINPVNNMNVPNNSVINPNFKAYTTFADEAKTVFRQNNLSLKKFEHALDLWLEGHKPFGQAVAVDTKNNGINNFELLLKVSDKSLWYPYDTSITEQCNAKLVAGAYLKQIENVL